MLRHQCIFILFVVISMWWSYVKGQNGAVIVENTTTALIFHQEKRDYQSASEYCRSNGSVLVNIKTASTHAAIFRKLVRTVDFFNPNLRLIDYWVGGYREENNNTWYWNDGSAIRMSNISSSQYSQIRAFGTDTNTSVSRCLSVESRDIRANIRTTGNWKVAPCSEMNYFICEKDLSKNRFGETTESLRPFVSGLPGGPTIQGSLFPQIEVGTRGNGISTSKVILCDNRSTYPIIIGILCAMLLILLVVVIYLAYRLNQKKTKLTLSSNASAAQASTNAYNMYEIPQVPFRASSSQAAVATTETAYLSPTRGLYECEEDVKELDNCGSQPGNAHSSCDDSNPYMEIPINILQLQTNKNTNNYLDMRAPAGSYSKQKTSSLDRSKGLI